MVGIEGNGQHTVELIVQPECKLPSRDAKGEYQWSLSDAVHPFWCINRCNTEATTANAEVKRQDMTHVMACSFEGLSFALATDTFSVSLPCIVNTHAVSSGAEVVLQRTQNKAKTDKKRKPEHTFINDIIASQKNKTAKRD